MVCLCFWKAKIRQNWLITKPPNYRFPVSGTVRQVTVSVCTSQSDSRFCEVKETPITVSSLGIYFVRHSEMGHRMGGGLVSFPGHTVRRAGLDSNLPPHAVGTIYSPGLESVPFLSSPTSFSQKTVLPAPRPLSPAHSLLIHSVKWTGHPLCPALVDTLKLISAFLC